MKITPALCIISPSPPRPPPQLTAGAAPRRPLSGPRTDRGRTADAWAMGRVSWHRNAYLVRPVLLVHVEDVDAEPVPLLKGPLAERAGKFPIAHVHAGGVPEMLISVVSVGKYFSTSFASVTFWGLCPREVPAALSVTVPHSYSLPRQLLQTFHYRQFKTYIKVKIIKYTLPWPTASFDDDQLTHGQFRFHL